MSCCASGKGTPDCDGECGQGVTRRPPRRVVHFARRRAAEEVLAILVGSTNYRPVPLAAVRPRPDLFRRRPADIGVAPGQRSRQCPLHHQPVRRRDPARASGKPTAPRIRKLAPRAPLQTVAGVGSTDPSRLSSGQDDLLRRNSANVNPSPLRAPPCGEAVPGRRGRRPQGRAGARPVGG